MAPSASTAVMLRTAFSLEEERRERHGYSFRSVLPIHPPSSLIFFHPDYMMVTMLASPKTWTVLWFTSAAIPGASATSEDKENKKNQREQRESVQRITKQT
jgi:hypothetical protein